MLHRILLLLTALLSLPLVAQALTPLPALAAARPSSTIHDPSVGPNALQEKQFGSTYGQIQPDIATAKTVTPDTATGASKEVLGFAPYWNLWDYAEWQYNLMSTVAYFSVDMNANGTPVESGSNWTAYQSSNLTSMVTDAHGAGDRVLLTITDMNDASIEDIVSSTSATNAAVANAISLAQAKGMNGIMVDFEGAAPSVNPTDFTRFIATLSTAVHSDITGGELAVATYGGSAATDAGEFNISALAPYVDAFFVMAYDMNFSNNAGDVQAAATAPLDSGSSTNPNYPYSDSTVIDCYMGIATQAMGSCPDSTVASKIILGVPYYGYQWNVGASCSGKPCANGSGSENTAVTYANEQSILQCAQKLSGPTLDTTSDVQWISWYSSANNDPCGIDAGSWQELYMDNAVSLNYKYSLVNSSGIRGVGMWALGDDTGYPQLWNALGADINVQHTPVGAVGVLPQVENTTCFTLSWGPAAGSIPAQKYIIFIQDSQTGTWLKWQETSNQQDEFCGFINHTYYFYAQAQGLNGTWSSGPPPSGTVAYGESATWISSSATASMPFDGLYGVDAYGNVDPVNSPPLVDTAHWSYPIINGMSLAPGGEGGYMVDAYGGIHSFGDAPPETGTGYWAGRNVTRGVAVASNGTSGYVVDLYGGIEQFGGAPGATITGYWPGRDIVRGIALCSNGVSGYTVDAEGGIHPFGTAGNVPPLLSITGHWNYNIVVGLAVNSTCTGGYTVDAYGGLHPFGDATPVTPSGYWPGIKIVRGVVLAPGGTNEGYTIDAWGGFHPFGGAPAVFGPDYSPTNDTIAGSTA